MHCNQPFCGNGFTNGPFYSSYSTPLHSTQSIYPEIVGEGEVTSVTLPDGSVQFFFMPTIKWWSPNASQCQPYPPIANPMFANTNSSIPTYNNIAGTWFIRRISNTLPQNVCNFPSQRNELLRNANNTACNMSTHDFGYQMKFHNDSWTSTTDLTYFYPSLRQRDFVFAPPCKDKTVQIDAGPVANSIVCHHEVECSKPCICCIGDQPMSLESLVDTKLTCKSNKATVDDPCCDGLVKKNHKRSKEKKYKRNKSKKINCTCGSTVNMDSTADKSVTTYADKGNDCNPADGRETQTRGPEESECCMDVKPIINKSLVKQKLRFSKSYSSCSTTDECSCDDSNKKFKRHKHVKYKLHNSKKCDCGCDSTTSSVSENETTASTDGCETPFCNIAKCACKKDAQDPPSEQNTAVTQWLSSDDASRQCELTSAPISLSSTTAMQGKSSENVPNKSNACDSNCTISYG